MLNKRYGYSLAVVLGLTIPIWAQAPDADESDAAKAFARLRGMEGTWVGPDADGDGEPDVEIVYRPTSAGKAMHVTQFPGTEHEMVNLIHMDGEDLVLTHYCAMGNQPRMKVAKVEEDSIAFEFVGGTNLTPGEGMYMGAVTMTFDGPNKVHEEWKTYVEGKADRTMVFELTRTEASLSEGDAAKMFPPQDLETFFFVFLNEGPNRSEADQQAAEERQPAHMAHLSELFETGHLKLGGPFEGGGGILILAAEDLAAAQALVDSDPHVKAGWLKPEIRVWYTGKGWLD